MQVHEQGFGDNKSLLTFFVPIDNISTVCFSSLETLEFKSCTFSETEVALMNSPSLFPRLENVTASADERGGTLRAVEIHKLTSYSDDNVANVTNVLSEVGRKATELKILRLISQEEIADGELSHLSALDNLTTLQIRHSAHFTWERGVKVLLFSNLTSLDLAGSLTFSNNNNNNGDNAKMFALSLPKLTELDISFCLLNDTCLFYITSIIKTLTSLNLASCPITEIGLKHVTEHAVNLKNLNLSGIKTFTSDGLSRLSSLSKLTTLHLNSCHDVNDHVLDALAKGVPGLVELRLKSCDDVQYKNPNWKFSSLTVLDLSETSHNNVEMTVQQLQTISLSFPNLKQLDFSGSAVYDPLGQGLNFIASSLANLESLSLRRCSRNGLGCITNIGVAALLTKLFRLVKLDISYCGDEITDELFSRNLASVRRLGLLNISGCTKVSPQIIMKIKSTCPRLHVEHDWFEPQKMEPASTQKCMLQ